MWQSFISTTKGIVSLTLYCLNMIILAMAILALMLVLCITPVKSWREWLMNIILKIPLLWQRLNYWIMTISAYGKWDIQGSGELSSQKWYLLVSNHRSWFDILLIGGIFHQKIPFIKFFMKKQLLWTLPIAGVACYFLGYPFMSRHTQSQIKKNPKLKGKDLETTRKACLTLKKRPSAVLNFVEGTRFSKQKQISKESPYRHLLRPKAAGIAMVMQEMHDCLEGVLDVTIHYRANKISLWRIACGRFDKITIHYQLYPINTIVPDNHYQDRSLRTNVQQWLNDVWLKKDKFLDTLNRMPK